MPSITLNFNNPLNVSLQEGVGDIVYYQDSSTQDIYSIGPCTDISGNSITCDILASTPPPTSGDFIFFGKNPEVNTSGVIGYYAEVDMEISSTSKKELFAVNSEIFISS
jgi:hypothetical protein